ncbi:MAG: Maf family nucleotide pyrophosphatase [Xanthomonadaceae bacterium]|nr:Maf family nucleotide pyrophosphatase [Xanthomonadaceae bacterium]
MAAPLILASTSPYRNALLARLGLPFRTCRPEVDETPDPEETPTALVLRLSGAKAAAAIRFFDDGLAIGSDQVAACEGRILGKPGDRAHAVEQLRFLSGRSVEFLTGVCVHDLATNHVVADLARTRVRFRTLPDAEIERYVDREPAFDCAGAFKSEGLGITLVEAIEEDDPTAIIGLPLIRLCGLLRQFGIQLP